MEIDRRALGRAMEDPARDREHVLDRQNNDIIALSATTMSLTELYDFKTRMEKDPDRYLRIPKVPSADGYQDMEDFIKSLSDPKLRLRLAQALAGRSAFREFRDLLESFPREEERWEVFKDKRRQVRIDDWLKLNGLTAPPAASRRPRPE